MSATFLNLLSILFLSTNAAVVYNGPAGQNFPGMPMNGMRNTNGTTIIRDNSYGRDDNCAKEAMDNGRLMEGVYMSKPNQGDMLTEQLQTQQAKLHCMKIKQETQKKIKQEVDNIIQKTYSEAKKQVMEGAERQKCVSKLDKSAHECFIKNVLNDFYTSVVWKVAVHDNVAELWYHDHLVLMIVYETVEYNIKSQKKECFTFFPNANVAVEENGLGSLLTVIGKPNTPNKKTAAECKPCSEFSKDSKTFEGVGLKCSNDCDPINMWFNSSSFRSASSEKPSTKDRPESPETPTESASAPAASNNE